jgi:hypothetical protein
MVTPCFRYSASLLLSKKGHLFLPLKSLKVYRKLPEIEMAGFIILPLIRPEARPAGNNQLHPQYGRLAGVNQAGSGFTIQ